MVGTPQLLSVGPLFTAGNQITDINGNPVQIAAINWNGFHVRNGAPAGLNVASYNSILDFVKATGFNCIRIPFCDSLVINNDNPSTGAVNASLNPVMTGLSCLGVLDKIFIYCATIGLRIILVSANNEGAGTVIAGQANGLWYDSGGASNGTDGSGNTGHVTDAAFLSMWQTIASRYSGSAALVGYDIRAKLATTGVGATWGDGSNRDARAMYQRVGNAIQAIDTRPLIICEGVINAAGTFATGTAADGIAYGTGVTFVGNAGDLSTVRSLKVVLNTPAKVVYGVHEYPTETSGSALDIGGQTKINSMTAVWGYLVKEAIAPVMITDMGSYFNGTAAQQLAATTWANMIIAYLQGVAPGGPRFTGVQEGPSWAWWTLDVNTTMGSVPDYGILSAWGGTALAAQSQYYNQILFYGSSGPAPAGLTPSGGMPSSNGTTVSTVGPAITDINGNLWTITSGFQVAVNGVTDTTTGSLSKLYLVGNLLWQGVNFGSFWSKYTPTDTWLPTGGTTVSPLGSAPVQSPDLTVITTAGPGITDANGNVWTLTAVPGQVAVNGVADTTTSGVLELAFISNHIWQENQSNLWWSKLLPSDTWLPTGGTSVNPVTSAQARGSTWNLHNAIAAWTPSSSVLKGARVAWNGVAYQCVVAGTTAASGGVTGTGSNIVDGTAHWAFLSNVDFVSTGGTVGALPGVFAADIVVSFWNDTPQTTTAGTAFAKLTGNLLSGHSLTLTASPQDSLRTALASQSVPLQVSSTYGTTFIQPSTVTAGTFYFVVDDP